MPLGKPRDFVTYPDLEAKNLTPEEGDNAAKRIDGVYFDDNNEDTNNALAIRQGFGVDFVDHGSSAPECRVTTPAGLFDAEHEVTIGDGTRLWKTAMFADDDLRFDEGDIVNGVAGPADYSSAGFIDSLLVWSTGSVTLTMMVDNTEMILTYDAPNALTADDIARSPTESEKVDTSLTNLETAFDVEHDGTTGAHDDGFLEPGMVNQNTCFLAEAWQNIIRFGRFDNWPAGIKSPPEGWALYGAPTTVQQESGAGNVRIGTYSVKITTGGASRGIKYAVPNFADYSGKAITASCWVKQSSAGTVAVTIDDGVGTTTGLSVVLSGTFQQAFCRHTMANAATKLEIIIASVGTSPAFYVDEFGAFQGDNLKAHSSHALEIVAADDVIPVNLMLNGGFGHWWDTTALSGHPDYWEPYTGTVVAQYYTTTPYFGNNCLRLDNTTGIGAGVCQRIGAISSVLSFLKGKTVCFSAFIKEYTPGTAKNFKIQVDDGVGSTPVTFDQDDYPSWTRVWVVHMMSAAATELTVSIQGSQVAAAGLLVDACCLNIGSRPMKWAGNMPSVWSPVRYAFYHSGAVADGVKLDEAWPVPERFYPMRLDAYWLTGPTRVLPAGNTDLILYTGDRGAAPGTTGFYVRVAAEAAPDADGVGATATQIPSTAEADVVAELKYIRIHTTNVTTSANPATPSVLLTGYTLTLP
ncbi:MAG: hypothetical protein NTW26_06995 [bacterium]|nr:hypothetical protein [bacterium]